MRMRNLLYDKNIIQSVGFDIPIISVGNLSLGGSGKTPQIEYLIELLRDKYNLAVVSRGYKRKTKGFILADESATYESIGDESFQIKRKFPEITVAVSEDRALGIQKIINRKNIDVILLDDAFQHRKIRAGLQIVLTPYNQLFYDDYIMPVGNLRERRKNMKRADIVVVTKCSESITLEEKNQITDEIKLYFKKNIFFSSIKYDDEIYRENKQISIENLKKKSILLITGIANPTHLYAYLSEKNITFESLKFGDHHHFSSGDIKRIKQAYHNLETSDKLILTTEKDYVRLKDKLSLPVYYLPIQTEIIEREMFNQKILDYVGKDE